MDASETAGPTPDPGRTGQVTTVEIDEVAARLRELVDEVRHSDLQVRLVLLPPARRVLGQDAGLFEVAEDFDDPLPDALVDAFGS